ncbi:MAG TPA: phage portal protein [Chthoniobacteraceae bacterium]|jgi:capsid protein|nr:phage portal protein [Chthoniobacteraceae bacterium]
MKFLQTLKSAAAGAMLGFVNAWGPFAEAVSNTPDRQSIFYFPNADTRQYLPSWTRQQINFRVEWLFQNFGIVKEAVRGIARYVVGKGIYLALNTDDEAWNAEAEADVECYMLAPDRCDLAGRRNGYEIQTFAPQARVKQGEFLAAIVPNPRWEDAPCIQLFDASEVMSPPSAESNPFIVDGIELDNNHCMVAIHVRGLDNTFTRIPRAQVIHW